MYMYTCIVKRLKVKKKAQVPLKKINLSILILNRDLQYWTGGKILQCCLVSPTSPFIVGTLTNSNSKDSLVDGLVMGASLAYHGCFCWPAG